MDIFGFKRRRKQRALDFVEDIPNQDASWLLTAWEDLDMHSMEGTGGEYNGMKLRAVEEELCKRGYCTELGQVLPYRPEDKRKDLRRQAKENML